MTEAGKAAEGAPSPVRRTHPPSDGYAMAALLVAMGVMGVVMSAAMPAWQTAARREREAELIFRGQQYARAIQLFQTKYANTLPPSLDVLINEKFLRKKYLDPIANAEFQLLGAGQAVGAIASTNPGRGQSTPSAGSVSLDSLARQTGGLPGGAQGQNPPGRGPTPGSVAGGIMGVTSRSTEKSLRLYNGRGAYNEWAFIPVQRLAAPGGGAGNAGRAGARGRGAAPDGRGGPGNLRPGSETPRPDGIAPRPDGGFRPPSRSGIGGR